MCEICWKSVIKTLEECVKFIKVSTRGTRRKYDNTRRMCEICSQQ